MDRKLPSLEPIIAIVLWLLAVSAGLLGLVLPIDGNPRRSTEAA